MKKIQVLAIALATWTRVVQAAPSAEERRIAAYALEHGPEAVALLERLVVVNSGTMNFEGVREVGRILRSEFDRLGFATRWIDVPETNRAGHLVAERQGSRGKRLLLIGHLDTVFEKDSPFQKFVREGKIAKGPGTNDMKGGDLVILFALKALKDAGALEQTTICAFFTGDEESPGKPLEVARRDLIDAAKRSDVALEFENAMRDAGRETATIARRSVSSWTLRVAAPTGHAQGIFGEEAGHGAVYETARILWAFHEQLREPYLTHNPALILGGTAVGEDGSDRGTAAGKFNVIAQTALVRGDLRALSDEQMRRARERMREITARSLPKAAANIEFADIYPAMSPTSGNRALLEVLNQVNRDLDLSLMEPLDPAKRGAADVSFVAPYVDALAGLGAFGTGGHSPEETVELDTLPQQIARAAVLMYRLTR
jgi:glutamate carboxypeptidase